MPLNYSTIYTSTGTIFALLAILILTSKRIRRKNYIRAHAIVRNIEEGIFSNWIEIEYLDARKSSLVRKKKKVSARMDCFVGDDVVIRYCRGRIFRWYTVVFDTPRDINGTRNYYIFIGLLLLLAAAEFIFLGRMSFATA